jgi:hypothetical protein
LILLACVPLAGMAAPDGGHATLGSIDASVCGRRG